MSARLIEPFRRWQRSRRHIAIATARFTTTMKDPLTSEEKQCSLHMVTFMTDANGRRWVETETSNSAQCKTHDSIVQCKVEWIHHSRLPSWARRVNAHGGAKLVSINGGKEPAA